MNPILLLLTSRFSLMSISSKQSFCFGGRHKTNSFDMFEKEKVNPKKNKRRKAGNGKCDIFGTSESDFLLSKEIN